MKKQKLTVAVILLITVFLNIVGCSSSTKKLSLKEEIQGYWYDEESLMVYVFTDNEYLIYGLGTGITINGNYDINSKDIILHSDYIDDKVFKQAEIQDDKLSFITQTGKKCEVSSISREKIDELLLMYDND